MKLLLDTSTFHWIDAGDARLCDAVRSLFVDPDNETLLSAASAWEIAVKHRLGKLPLPDDPRRFVPGQRLRHRIAELPVTEEAALATARLPDLHRDPFDRIPVAQAISVGATILTSDPLVAQYPARTAW